MHIATSMHLNVVKMNIISGLVNSSQLNVIIKMLVYVKLVNNLQPENNFFTELFLIESSKYIQIISV